MEWIHVKTEKPPLNKIILVTDGDDIMCVEICAMGAVQLMTLQGVYGHDWNTLFDYVDITHWVETPALPKK